MCYEQACTNRYQPAIAKVYHTATGVRTGAAGSAAAPATFGAEKQWSRESLSMWQTDGDGYLQVEVVCFCFIPSSTVSVRLSVCPSKPAALQICRCGPGGYIDELLQQRRTNAGSTTLPAYVGSRT